MKITYDRHYAQWDDTLDNSVQAQPLNVIPGDLFIVLEQRDSHTMMFHNIYVERSAVEELIEALRRAT